MDDLTEHPISSDTHHPAVGGQPSMMSPDQGGLNCDTSLVEQLTRQTSSALPPSSGDPLHDWRIRSLLATTTTTLFIKAASIQGKNE